MYVDRSAGFATRHAFLLHETCHCANDPHLLLDWEPPSCLHWCCRRNIWWNSIIIVAAAVILWRGTHCKNKKEQDTNQYGETTRIKCVRAIIVLYYKPRTSCEKESCSCTSKKSHFTLIKLFGWPKLYIPRSLKYAIYGSTSYFIPGTVPRISFMSVEWENQNPWFCRSVNCLYGSRWL